ncbi:MAG: acetyl-CoA carboxylase biotin carboxylase subunit [Chitinophagales bacterium]|nr:acetyl-CoA carboxylase biotin carboxylase subunit [Chitinophagales bacterium]
MKKVLIANRGEIALRIMRSLREMDITTVAVFSEADRLSPHVLFADEAVCIGPPASSSSYLLQDKIIKVAKQLNVEGIHPGYGFLSENAEFARKVSEAGIKFIGPSVHSIELMGSKLAAKEAVAKYDVPLVPGSPSAITQVEEGKKIAKKIGYPVLIKASAGGGGKGMRVVHKEVDFEDSMERAISEAKSAFGNGSVFIEKFVSNPRHIEFQIMADQHGNVIHLFERECSIQRRHQKVIEEAPSALMDEDTRAKMGKTATDVAKSCKYEGAGTVEFLMDGDKNFYFLEMNTRLQVEHPVTEYITGIDIVKEQINIARGEKLSYQQDEIEAKGHSIELRIYAEDPDNNFLPDTGKLEIYLKPEGPGIRVDDGYRQGMEVPIYYDPLLAKLIVYDENRPRAISRMKRAIEEYRIVGVRNTLSFGSFVMSHPEFISGDFDTHFVEKNFSNRENAETGDVEQIAQIGAFIFNNAKKNPTSENGVSKSIGVSKWKSRRSES